MIKNEKDNLLTIFIQVEVKPYVLDDQLCDECQGGRCGGKFAPFFCANVTCLQVRAVDNKALDRIKLLARDIVSVLLRAVLVLYSQSPGARVPQASGQGGGGQAQGRPLQVVLEHGAEASISILKIDSSGFLLLLCLEDQHPSLCNML